METEEEDEEGERGGRRSQRVGPACFLSVAIKHTGTLTPCNDSTSLLLILAALGFSIIPSLKLGGMYQGRGPTGLMLN